jgi:RNA polymerase sigma factor (sigma-70 family)
MISPRHSPTDPAEGDRLATPTGTAQLEAQLEENHQAAFGWALANCGWDREMAEDVLQTAYLKVVDGRARFDGRSSLRTWLFGVIRRTASEERRRRAVRRVVTLEVVRGRHEEAEGGTSPAEEVVRLEQSRRLIQALGMLPSRQQQVLHLVFYQDMTIAEAAEVLGVSVGTARTHYERGKQRLRDLLGKETRDG